jgi:hypothetical protein
MVREDAEVGPLDEPSAKKVERVSEKTSVSFEKNKEKFISSFDTLIAELRILL